MKNFLRFSQVISNLTDEESAWLIKYIEHRHRKVDLDGNECEYFFDDDMYPDFGFHIMEAEDLGKYAWFYSNEFGNISQLAETVQEFLKAHRPTNCFFLTWADYADLLEPGQFDGGAVFVTAKEIKMFHATEWVREQEREFNGPPSSTSITSNM